MNSSAFTTIAFHFILTLMLLSAGTACSGPSSSMSIDGKYYYESDSLRGEDFFSEAEKNQIASYPFFTLNDGLVQFAFGFKGTYHIVSNHVQITLVEHYKTSLFINLSRIEDGKIYLLFRIEDNGDLTWLRNDGSGAMRFEKR
jgi:hypothetical protein